jgi:exopolysaccharide biosynthesis protein PssK
MTPAAATPELLIAELQRRIADVLRPLLADTRAVALVGFPNYANVGDSAIWLGTLECLRVLGIAPPRYVCDAANYSRRRLAQHLGDGTILLQGGGNLGDVWEEHQRFRETVIAAFPDNPIVQLPQSIWFRDRAALARARQVFDRHPNLTLLLREPQSLAIAANELHARSLLCPDMAFRLGALPRPTATQALVWLARSDAEAAAASQVPMGAAVKPVDWLTERAPALLLARRLGRHGLLPASSYDWLARRRLRRGTRLLGAGRVVITDRLHGHILCLLLGIPHVLLDNRYGKVRSFHEAWTRDCGLVRWCDTGSEALGLARELAHA